MSFQNTPIRATIFKLVAFLFFTGLLTQQTQAQPVTSASKVTVTTAFTKSAVLPGSSLQTSIVMDIEEGWHINANRPTLEWLIGTTLNLEFPEGLSANEILFPPFKEYEFSFAQGQQLHVYEGVSPIFMNVVVAEGVTPGEYLVSGTLRVQACDDMVCLAPSNIPVEFTITVTDDPSQISDIKAAVFESYEPGSGDFVTFDQAGEQNQIAALIDESGLFWAFVAIFFIGLALNLTPCVYPMISVTVSIFGGQSDTNMARVFAKALTYVLGIATMYSVLGVIAALSGGLFGSALQSPIVLAVIGLLLMGLALSMFGLYEIQMPYWLTSKLGGQSASGFIGVYISGLVVGVFAAPCIGPPIIALLAFVGAKGDPVFGFWSFFILSLGLGFPYLILGTFSGLLQKLPKSGVWMVWVKKVFGIVLVGVGLFYLGLAFFPKYTPWVLALTLLLGGIYLGFLERSGLDKKVFRAVKWAVGLVGIVFGILMIQNLTKPTVEWTPYDPASYEQALADGRPVVLDFYADWCIPCLELDQVTFVDPGVIEGLDRFERFKVDLTNFDSEESNQLREQFNIVGVPTIVFVGSDGREVNSARVIGFLNPKDFMDQVNKVE